MLPILIEPKHFSENHLCGAKELFASPRKFFRIPPPLSIETLRKSAENPVFSARVSFFCPRLRFFTQDRPFCMARELILATIDDWSKLHCSPARRPIGKRSTADAVPGRGRRCEGKKTPQRPLLRLLVPFLAFGYPPQSCRGSCRGDKVVGYASVTDPIDKRTTGEGAPSRG